MPDELLDEGFGLPLRKLAFTMGSTENQRIQYLLSEAVHQSIVLAFESSAASSLPVERAFAETKRSEAPRLCHVATAGRNQILRQYLRQRQELMQEAESAAAALRRSMTTNIASLAWELYPELAELALQRGSAAMRQFIACRSQALRCEVERRRASARSAVDRVAHSSLPLTRQAWTDWFRNNQDEFF